MTWQEELKHWIETQHGTAGWPQKLESFMKKRLEDAYDEGYKRGVEMNGEDTEKNTCKDCGKRTEEYCEKDDEGNIVADRCCGSMCAYHCQCDKLTGIDLWLTEGRTKGYFDYWLSTEEGKEAITKNT